MLYIWNEKAWPELLKLGYLEDQQKTVTKLQKLNLCSAEEKINGDIQLQGSLQITSFQNASAFLWQKVCLDKDLIIYSTKYLQA